MLKTHTLPTLTREAKKIPLLIKKYGYKNKEELLDDALQNWILQLQKQEFMGLADKIKEIMRKRGITEEEVLQDFEEFRHRNK